MTRAADVTRHSPRRVFRDRREAGRVLADLLSAYRDRQDVIVLGLARPADQFDAMIHIDSTRALEPLEPTSLWIAGETPETYPSGL
jgi:erythromycin esterase-like protein